MTSDAAKVSAIRAAFDLGSGVTKAVNAGRGWGPTKQRMLERELTRVLRTILGRDPTREEVAAAGGED